MRARSRGLVAVLAGVLMAACASGPGQVLWGEEACAHCQMVISDERFAAQVVDSRGKAWKFDAIECMVAFLDDGTIGDGYTAWVADGRTAWAPAGSAHFLRGERIRSPMGGGLMAFADQVAAEDAARDAGGAVLDWRAVLAAGAVQPHGSHGQGGH